MVSILEECVLYEEIDTYNNIVIREEIWIDRANSPTPKKEDRVQIVTNDEFHFLDMKMSWSPEGDLHLEFSEIKESNLNTSEKRAPTHPVISARSPPESSTA